MDAYLDHVLQDAYRTSLYGDGNGIDTVDVVAVDSSGNRSEPATLDLNLEPCNWAPSRDAAPLQPAI